MKKLALFSFLVFVFISCETDVTDKVKTDAYNGASLISVSGAVTDISDQGTYLDLAISSPYLETSEASSISGAIIEVYENDILVSTLNEVAPGRYEDSTLQAVVGNGYRLLIDVPSGYGNATGFGRAPQMS